MQLKGAYKIPEYTLSSCNKPYIRGVISDIAKIAEIVHAHGAVLLADEAHGSHLIKPYFTGGAINAGRI